MMDINAFLLVATLLLFVGFGLLCAGRSGGVGVNSFAVGDRRYHWFQIACGMSATVFGGASVFSLSSLGYTFGWWALIDPVSVATALVATAWFWLGAIKRRDAVSLGTLLGDTTEIRMTIGMVSAVTYTLIAAAQIVALTKLVAPAFPGISVAALALCLAVGVGLYVFRGGYTSVTKTDVMQLGMILFLFLLPIVISAQMDVELSGGHAITQNMIPLDLALLLALPLLFIPVSQDLHIRVQSARDESHARRGLMLAALFYVAMTGMSIWVGMHLAQSGIALSDPEQAVPFYLTHIFGDFAIVPTLALFAVLVSTLDSTIFSASVSLGYELRRSCKNPGMATLPVLVVALGIAIWFQQVLHLVLLAMTIYIAVLLPLFVGIRLSVSRRELRLSSLAVITLLLLCTITGYQVPYSIFVFTGAHLAFVLLRSRTM